MFATTAGRYLVEHRLGIQVVTLLQHLQQYLVHGVKAVADAISVARLDGRVKVSLNHNARLGKLGGKALNKVVFTAQQQRRQCWVIIIPAPSFAIHLVILHALIGIDVTTYGVYPHLAYRLNKGAKVVEVEARVEASHAIYITVQRVVFNLSCIAQFGIKLVATPQTVEGRDGRNQFHG